MHPRAFVKDKIPAAPKNRRQTDVIRSNDRNGQINLAISTGDGAFIVTA